MKLAHLTSLVVAAGCGGAHPAGAPIANTATPVVSASPVRAVDWANRTYIVDEAGGYTVTDGGLEFAYDDNGNQVGADYVSPDPDHYVERGEFSVSRPVFGDVTGDGVEEAVIVTTLNSGGTGRFTGVSVFAMPGGTVTVIGEIPGGDRGDGGIAEVAIEGRAVLVERYQSGAGDGACCPSKIAHERWTWDGHRFVEDEAARTVTDNDEQF